MGNATLWTLDGLMAACGCGAALRTRALFGSLGKKWFRSWLDVAADYYAFAKPRTDGDERSDDAGWAGRVARWGKDPRTRTGFLKELGRKRSEREARDRLGLDTLADAREFYLSRAYSTYSVTSRGVALGDLELSVSDAHDILLREVDRHLAQDGLNASDRKAVKAAVLRTLGWSDEEIGGLLGIGTRSVRMYRHRGKVLLLKVLRLVEADEDAVSE